MENSICHSPSEHKFFVYFLMVRNLRVCPPFTDSEQSILRTLRLTPTQLHLNGWAFSRAFEIAMGVFEELVTTFNVVLRMETDLEAARQEHVSLKGDRKHKLFKSYTDSINEFKHRYVYVTPVNQAPTKTIAFVDEVGEITGYKFPFASFSRHICATTKSYSRKPSQLGAEEALTLKMLQ